MSHANEHQLIHEVDNLSSGHKFLFEGFYSEGEGCGIHQHGAFGGEMTHYLLYISLEIALE